QNSLTYNHGGYHSHHQHHFPNEQPSTPEEPSFSTTTTILSTASSYSRRQNQQPPRTAASFPPRSHTPPQILLRQQQHRKLTNTNITNTASSYLPMLKKRIRYRKLHPRETTGITEEMRFVAMRLRNDKINNPVSTPAPTSTVEDGKEKLPETCHPSLEGFIRFLVDNQHVFATLERIIDDSDDVSYAYLRKTGLE
ncbi:hypothetical protein RYX36_001296, partial [Vicia faba]